MGWCGGGGVSKTRITRSVLFDSLGVKIERLYFLTFANYTLRQFKDDKIYRQNKIFKLCVAEHAVDVVPASQNQHGHYLAVTWMGWTFGDALNEYICIICTLHISNLTQSLSYKI